MRKLIDPFLVFLSSLLLVLSFPKFSLGFLAWVGLLPLLIGITYRRVIYSFLLSSVCGILFFSGAFYWIFAVPKYSLLHHAPLIIYFGLYFGVFGLIYSFLSRRLGITSALFAAPFIWVTLEYIRSNLSFLSLPWALFAHSQYQYAALIQIASVTGTYSLSFLIVMVNATLASLFLGRLESPLPQQISPSLPFSKGGVTPPQKEGRISLPLIKGKRVGFQINKKGIISLVTIAASLSILTLAYGFFTITNTITGNKIKISLVQGNIEQIKKWDQKFAQEIMQRYSELTQKVSKEKPDLIIWPETATPGSISVNPEIFGELINILKDSKTYLLLGSANQEKFLEKGSSKFRYYNSAYLLNLKSNLANPPRYDKIRLFPFGEYLPYKDKIPWAYMGVSKTSEYIPGKIFTIFHHPDFRFGAIICWENVFPDLVRQFVRRGAQFIVNLTNEAHFGKTAAPYQLVAISVFRAVENKVYVVRCANTGVSCIIDPYGRIVDRIKDEKGQDIFVKGTMTGEIIPLDSKTIYTRYGDWFIWVALFGTLIFLIVSFFRKIE